MAEIETKEHTKALIAAIMAAAIFQKTDVAHESPEQAYFDIFLRCHSFLETA